MHDELLFMASRALSYPEEESREDYLEIKEVLEEIEAESHVKYQMRFAFEGIYELPVFERQKLYVSTFDLKRKHGLYLTGHEFGDSPKRGAALIRLQNIIKEAGYDHVEGELADYIPMLLELAAVAEATPDLERLMDRLSLAIYEIHIKMEAENPYTAIFDLLMTYVFVPPTFEQLESMKRNREKADLEELPYPLLYQ